LLDEGDYSEDTNIRQATMKSIPRIVLVFTILSIIGIWIPHASAKGLLNIPEQTRQSDEMITEFSREIVVDPKNVRAYTNRARARAIRWELQECLADANKAISLDGNYAYAYRIRGNAYRCMGQLQKSIEDSSTAIRLNPREITALVNRASAYDTKGQYQAAIDDYSQVIRLDARDGWAYRNRGADYVNLGQFQKAIDDCTQAINLYPDFDSAYAVRAAAHGKLGQFRKQVSDSTVAIVIAPRYSTAYVQRGFGFASQGEYGRAFCDFGMAIITFVDIRGLAIMLPLLTLFTLIIAATGKGREQPREILNHELHKHVFSNRFWTIISGFPAGDYPFRTIQTPLFVQLAFYVVSFLSASFVMNWFISQSLWKGELNWTNSWLLNELSPLFLYSILSIACTLPLFWLFESFLYRRKNAAYFRNGLPNSGILIHTFNFTALLLLLLPVISLFLCSPTSFEYQHLRDLFLVLVAISMFPAGSAGFTVASASLHVVFGQRGETLANNYKLMMSPSFGIAGLDGVAEERLHDLVDLALTVGDLEKGDLLSQLLLERAELQATVNP
jgi:tetratricopeptide (TPR) repeat protein